MSPFRLICPLWAKWPTRIPPNSTPPMPSPTPYSFQFPIHSPMTAASANMLTVRAISLIGHILAKIEEGICGHRHTINKDYGIGQTGGLWRAPHNATGEIRLDLPRMMMTVFQSVIWLPAPASHRWRCAAAVRLPAPDAPDRCATGHFQIWPRIPAGVPPE